MPFLDKNLRTKLSTSVPLGMELLKIKQNYLQYLGFAALDEIKFEKLPVLLGH
jgi:hypothetical protein